ncbi:UDP-N-acetylglucosamine 1-carboxyvinyltransferase 2 [compost metagenome]
MGAKIRVEGRSAIIEGGRLNAAKVKAADLRAGAALVIAGLTVGDGITEVTGVEYIDRGYDNLVTNMRDLGAEIWREED